MYSYVQCEGSEQSEPSCYLPLQPLVAIEEVRYTTFYNSNAP
jgi:hypothetical protein